jgi:hypothetical protein
MGIVDNVINVIKAYEFMILQRPIDDDCANKENKADEKALVLPTDPISLLGKSVFFNGHDRYTVPAESVPVFSLILYVSS